jgi:hypothetical protein
MKKASQEVENPCVSTPVDTPSDREIASSSRRKFLGRLGTAATVTVAAGVLGGPAAVAEGGLGDSSSPTNPRVARALSLRLQAANSDAKVTVPPHTTSGDEALYHDKSASFSKCILQDYIGVVNPAAWISFRKACNSGKPADWNNVIIGGTRTLNGPQGSYAFDLESLDAVQYGNAPGVGDPTGLVLVPPFDQYASAAFGTQMIEQYWASLLRDVAFTDYDGNATAQAAAAELNAQPTYRGPRDSSGNVTTANLFRGPWAGEQIGPYMSQLMITPCSYGAQPISQLLTTYLPGIDYMTDPTTFLQVQQGQPTGLTNQVDPTVRYLHDGRGLGAYTHVDVLYQGYFTAFLVLSALKAPLNPGNPYVGNKTQNGFCTFGGPDFAASLGEIAARALDKVWYQKWVIHLTPRPEATGGVVWQLTEGKQKIDAVLNSNLLNSQALAASSSQYGTTFLSQAFPEGSPSHPSYPTGHGTVGGACITLLKFFFDETWVIPNPLVPSSDGLSLNPYTGSDAGQITVMSELHKLASNVSYGHGIHPGIHWRTDTDNSILLGEAIAISYLQDKAKTYNEKFSVTFTKLDGNPITISNL